MTTQPTTQPTTPDAPTTAREVPAIVAVPMYWLWRLTCLLRALVDGGSIHGCCTCGGTSSTWRYWGATDTYAGWLPSWGRPPSDWAECDRCHNARPAGDWMLTLDHERHVRPLYVRVGAWLAVAAIALGVTGAIVGPDRPTPFGAVVAGVLGVVLLVLAVASTAADWMTRNNDDSDDAAAPDPDPEASA